MLERTESDMLIYPPDGSFTGKSAGTSSLSLLYNLESLSGETLLHGMAQLTVSYKSLLLSNADKMSVRRRPTLGSLQSLSAQVSRVTGVDT